MKISFKTLWVILILAGTYSLNSQTVGLFLQTENSHNGYTLFSPNASRNTYLIDNCGKEVHRWSSDYTPGLSVYLMENGDLLRTNRISSSFPGGGTGGRVERRNWNNNVIWAYNFSNADYHQHHDIEPMPNGNILVVLWEKVPSALLQSSGRQLIGSNGLWSTYIMEVKPVNSNEIEIVWEWRAFDHLIQNEDETLANYGVIADHPDRIDVNLDASQSADWLHVNGIDYNESLDQIAISVHDLHEIWVIDHSTTIEESKSDTGGRYGKGGDLLYRWGNPRNYGRGTLADQRLFGQHDVKWIESGRPEAGSFSVFNNGAGRPGPNLFSSVEVWLADQDSAGYYHLDSVMPFGPENADWTVGEGAVEFYSSRISGTQRLPNGNTLICSGRGGQFLEVDSAGNLVWEYINPISNNPISQGSTPFANDVFRATRYDEDYAAFHGRDLTPGEPLEADPDNYECDIFVSTDDLISTFDDGIKIYPNPVDLQLTIDTGTEVLMNYSVRSSSGNQLLFGQARRFIEIDVSALPRGFYFVILTDKENRLINSTKFIRN